MRLPLQPELLKRFAWYFQFSRPLNNLVFIHFNFFRVKNNI